MNAILIEFLLSLYFIGNGVSITASGGNGTPRVFSTSVDYFKLVLGIVLLVLAFVGFAIVK